MHRHRPMAFLIALTFVAAFFAHMASAQVARPNEGHRAGEDDAERQGAEDA